MHAHHGQDGDNGHDGLQGQDGRDGHNGQRLRELELEATLGGIGDESDSTAIPVISLADFDQRWDTIVAQLWSAATEVGFFQLADHGVSADLIETGFGAAQRFFALDDEAKADYPWRRDLNAGWESRAQVRPSTRVADQKESFQMTAPNMAGLWPGDDRVPGFRGALEALERASWTLAMRVLSCFADRLGFDRNFFADRHDPQASDYQSTLRLLHYFPMTAGAFSEGQWRAGAHTDYDCLTLLFQRSDQSGLQVAPGGDAGARRWTSVVADETLITCNIGDMLMRWSDDQLRSTLHRVRGPRPEDPVVSRYSIAFFAQANRSAVISSPTGRFEPLTAEQFLQQRIAANFAR